MARNDGNGSPHRGALAAAALLIFFAASVASADAPGPNPDTPSAAADSLAARIAERYGAGMFHRVQSIRFTFNVRFKGKEVSREWTWFPRVDSVVYRGEDAKGLKVQASYSRRNPYGMKTPSVAAIDKSFINDQYWLLFPLHLAWDGNLTFTIAPGSRPGEARRLTVAYPKEIGYTPGDAYDLFVDSTATIRRWIFRKGNSPQPTREASWSEPVLIGGLPISLEHAGPDKEFKLWFSDVQVDAGPT